MLRFLLAWVVAVMGVYSIYFIPATGNGFIDIALAPIVGLVIIGFAIYILMIPDRKVYHICMVMAMLVQQ